MRFELEEERKKNQISSGQCAIYRTRLGLILGHTPLAYAVTKTAMSSRHKKYPHPLLSKPATGNIAMIGSILRV